LLLGVVSIQKPATSGNTMRKSPISQMVNSDKQAAVRASIKLDAGDVKGAMHFLVSNDAFVIPDALSYNTLLSKHPAKPSDRHQSPPITSDADSYTVPQLLSAVKYFGPGSASG